MTRQEFWTAEYNRQRARMLARGKSERQADRLAEAYANVCTKIEMGEIK